MQKNTTLNISFGVNRMAKKIIHIIQPDNMIIKASSTVQYRARKEAKKINEEKGNK